MIGNIHRTVKMLLWAVKIRQLAKCQQTNLIYNVYNDLVWYKFLIIILVGVIVGHDIIGNEFLARFKFKLKLTRFEPDKIFNLV